MSDMLSTANGSTAEIDRDRYASIRQAAVGCSLVLLLLVVWAFIHQYHGFERDGQLYAFQALARLHPWLRSDLYLQYTSQDDFSIFSPLYAFFINLLGLQTAEMLLFSICTAGFLFAAWVLVRALSGQYQAFGSVVLLICIVGHYGANGIFSFAENYLTARTLSECLIVASLACHFAGQRFVALAIGLVSLFVHPLMAFPGVMLLVCQWLRLRMVLVLAGSGVAAALAAYLAAGASSGSLPLLKLMDPMWLKVVCERSQFLFLRYWEWGDWEIAARPFVCLTLALLALDDVRVRKLGITAMVVGLSGLAVAAIAGSPSPPALLVQGQAWRWMWITTLVSMLLLVPTMMQMARSHAAGPLAAVLLLLGWAYDPVDGLACVEVALLLWLVRDFIPITLERYVFWAATAVGATAIAWTTATCWTYFHASPLELGRESILLGRLRQCFGLCVPALIFAFTIAGAIRKMRSVWLAGGACVGLAAAAVWILPGSMMQLDDFGSEAKQAEFADWRAAIPAASNVLVLSTGKSSLFQWFTLQRPSYLSLSESAGVVFSQATAAEVVRRSTVLLPLREPDWMILSSIESSRSAAASPPSSAGVETLARALSGDSLANVCADTQLDFVIARDYVGFEPLKHQQSGMFKDWYLYSCRTVRSTGRVG